MGAENSKSKSGSTSSGAQKNYPHIYELSKDCTRVDEFTIKDNNSGNIFKAKRAGIRFNLLATNKNQEMAHSGLLLDNNTFVTPNGTEFCCLLVHRVKEQVRMIFSNS